MADISDMKKNMKFFCSLEPNNLIAFLQSTYMIVLIKTYFFVWLTAATPDISLGRFCFSIYRGIYQGVINKYLSKKHVFVNNIMYKASKNAIKSIQSFGSCISPKNISI